MNKTIEKYLDFWSYEKNTSPILIGTLLGLFISGSVGGVLIGGLLGTFSQVLAYIILEQWRKYDRNKAHAKRQNNPRRR